MKNNTSVFLFLVGSAAIFKTATAVVISCGQNMCLCNDQKRSAKCERNGELLFFPDLPSYIEEVTFKHYRRQNISVSDLSPLSRLPLTTLKLQEMHIHFLQMGLFQSF